MRSIQIKPQKNEQFYVTFDTQFVISELPEDVDKLRKASNIYVKEFILEKPNVKVEIIYPYVFSLEQDFSLKLHIDHKAAQTASRVDIYGIINGRGKTKIDGFINIRKNADNTSALYTHKIITLSNNFTSVTNPSFYIENNNVEAYHAVSSSPLDESSLLYFGSRGLDKDYASNLILQAFIEQGTQKIYDESVKTMLRKKLYSEIS